MQGEHRFTIELYDFQLHCSKEKFVMKKIFLRIPERATVRIRTENLLIRNQLLYPFELW